MTLNESLQDAMPDLRIEVNPEPTDDERDALVAALAVVLSMPTGESATVSVEAPPSRWARAGRDAAFANRDIGTRRSRQL